MTSSEEEALSLPHSKGSFSWDHRISLPTSQLYVQQVELVPIAGGGMMSETLSKRCVIMSLCLYPTYPFGKETERVRECVWVRVCVG